MDGGVGVGSLKIKNLALLCKWFWRFRTEESAFWVRIIKSLYGNDGGLNLQQPPINKGPWAAIYTSSRPSCLKFNP